MTKIKMSRQFSTYRDTSLKEVHYYFFFSRCDKALPAILFVLSLERPSCRAFEAFEATSFEVTFFAIAPPFFS